MQYLNNGYKRGTKVIVEKYSGDELESGYPKTYDALLSFSDYSALTEDQFSKLSETAFAERMDAFEAYVEGIEAGASFDDDIVAGSERLIYDTTSCPRGW